MKRTITVALSLLILVLALWFYMATQFEQMVNELLPKIKNASVVTIDIDKISIEKFKFTLNLKDVILLPKLCNAQIDYISLFCNPFSDRILISLGGEKLTIGTKDSTYVKSPNISFAFSRKLLEGNSKDIEIEAKIKDFVLRFTKNDEFIRQFSDASINISAQYGDECSLGLNLDVDNIKTNIDSQHSSYSLEGFLPEFIVNPLNNIIDYCFAVYDKTGPINYAGHYSAKFDKDTMTNLTLLIQEPDKFFETHKDFDLTKQKFYISMEENFINDTVNDYGYAEFLANGEKVSLMGKISFDYNYTDSQKDAIFPITREFFMKLMKDLSKIYNSNKNNEIIASKDDFSHLAKTHNDINNIKFDFNIEYDIESSNYKYDSNFELDDFGFKIDKGKLSNKIVSLTTEIRTASSLIDAITDIYNNTARNILKKNQNYYDITIECLDSIANHIQADGLNVLSVLHDAPDLKDNDVLKTKIYADIADLKINNKHFVNIITNQHIIKFLQLISECQYN